MHVDYKEKFIRLAYRIWAGGGGSRGGGVEWMHTQARSESRQEGNTFPLI